MPANGHTPRIRFGSVGRISDLCLLFHLSDSNLPDDLSHWAGIAVMKADIFEMDQSDRFCPRQPDLIHQDT